MTGAVLNKKLKNVKHRRRVRVDQFSPYIEILGYIVRPITPVNFEQAIAFETFSRSTHRIPSESGKTNFMVGSLVSIRASKLSDKYMFVSCKNLRTITRGVSVSQPVKEIWWVHGNLEEQGGHHSSLCWLPYTKEAEDFLFGSQVNDLGATDLRATNLGTTGLRTSLKNWIESDKFQADLKRMR